MLATGELGVDPVVVDNPNHSTGAVTDIAAVYQRAQNLNKCKDALELVG